MEQACRCLTQGGALLSPTHPTGPVAEPIYTEQTWFFLENAR